MMMFLRAYRPARLGFGGTAHVRFRIVYSWLQQSYPCLWFMAHSDHPHCPAAVSKYGGHLTCQEAFWNPATVTEHDPTRNSPLRCNIRRWCWRWSSSARTAPRLGITQASLAKRRSSPLRDALCSQDRRRLTGRSQRDQRRISPALAAAMTIHHCARPSRS
jgi:hypothetical protein